MAETLPLLMTWPDSLERHLLHSLLWVDAGRVRLPRSLPVGLLWEKGRVRGTVEVPGGRFLVTLHAKPLPDRAWKWAIEELVRRPAASQALLAGRLDAAVIEAFEDAGASLFVRGTRQVECSCKGERECRHRLALVAQMAEEAAANPFLWLTVLGREREEFLAALRVALMAELPESDEGALERGRFWAVPAGASRGAGAPDDSAQSLPATARPLLSRSGMTLVDQLGPVPQVDGPLLSASRTGTIPNYRSLTEFLQLYARQVAEGAQALRAGAKRIPDPPPPPPPRPSQARKLRSRRRRR